MKTTFESLPIGTKFTALKHSYIIFTKTAPSVTPQQHNAVSSNLRQAVYDWFDAKETVHDRRKRNV